MVDKALVVVGVVAALGIGYYFLNKQVSATQPPPTLQAPPSTISIPDPFVPLADP